MKTHLHFVGKKDKTRIQRKTIYLIISAAAASSFAILTCELNKKDFLQWYRFISSNILFRIKLNGIYIYQWRINSTRIFCDFTLDSSTWICIFILSTCSKGKENPDTWILFLFSAVLSWKEMIIKFDQWKITIIPATQRYLWWRAQLFVYLQAHALNESALYAF